MANGDDEEGEGEDSEELGFFVSIAGDHTRNRLPPLCSCTRSRRCTVLR